MRYALLNLLACPMCKHFPLELKVFESVKEKRKFSVESPFCDTYCAYLRKPVKELKTPPPCEECLETEVKYGVLICPNCGRWYPIIDGIPLMYPDKRRRHPRVREREVRFVDMFSVKYPELFQKLLSVYDPRKG
ncbi:MAG: Trm112 family protein [Desulfurococcales archaeon]|nr:Trm112 family protein [Desulfurococcales archaeon]